MWKEAAADSSTIIYVAKADCFEPVSQAVETLLAPPSVWSEAVEAGMKRRSPEVDRIIEAEREGLLGRIELSNTELATARDIAAGYSLGRGESECLAIAPRVGHVVINDGRATRVAQGLGLRVTSTLFLPLLARRGGMPSAEAIRMLHRQAIPTRVSAEAVLALEKELVE